MMNSISLAAVSELVNEIRESPDEGIADYAVQLDWQTGTRCQVRTQAMSLGPHKVNRNFAWTIDEPRQLGGTNHGPNPQEVLLSGLGSCLMVAYIIGASVLGVRLESLSLQVSGSIDLRGFFGIGEDPPVGFSGLSYRVEVTSDATEAQLQLLHKQVQERSPNRRTLAEGVHIQGEMIVVRS